MLEERANPQGQSPSYPWTSSGVNPLFDVVRGTTKKLFLRGYIVNFAGFVHKLVNFWISLGLVYQRSSTVGAVI